MFARRSPRLASRGGAGGGPSELVAPESTAAQASGQSARIASPRTFNLTVSNIPGPRVPMYMLGCEMEVAYPVVPIADKHALSIGMTTIGDRACFGLYAACEMLPDSDALAAAMDASIDELLEQVTS